MSDIRVASRYAKSLIQISSELNILEDTYKDMQLIHNTCNSSKDLVLLLNSPLVHPDKKQTIINSIFSSSLSKVSNSFVELITKKKREQFLPEIAAQFISQYKKKKNINIARVITAIPLSDEVRKEIPKIIESTMDKDATIELIEEVNADLIGGMVLRIGDKQMDDSIRKKIRKLEREFSKNSYVKKF